MMDILLVFTLFADFLSSTVPAASDEIPLPVCGMEHSLYLAAVFSVDCLRVCLSSARVCCFCFSGNHVVRSRGWIWVFTFPKDVSYLFRPWHLRLRFFCNCWTGVACCCCLRIGFGRHLLLALVFAAVSRLEIR